MPLWPLRLRPYPVKPDLHAARAHATQRRAEIRQHPAHSHSTKSRTAEDEQTSFVRLVGRSLGRSQVKPVGSSFGRLVGLVGRSDRAPPVDTRLSARRQQVPRTTAGASPPTASWRWRKAAPSRSPAHPARRRSPDWPPPHGLPRTLIARRLRRPSQPLSALPMPAHAA